MNQVHIERFHSNVDSTADTSKCWNWKKSLTHKGYGQAWDGKTVVRANRVAYMLANNVELTTEQHIMHTCDNRACCNPNHLVLGTNADNMADKVAKCRQSKGQGTGMSKLTPKQIIEIRNDYANEIRRVTAKIFNVTPQAISNILSGSRWKHI